MTRFFLYSNFGAHLGEIEALEAVHSCEINNTDELELTCTESLTARDRVLWHDGTKWQEHVFAQAEQEHTKDGINLSYILRASYQADLRLSVIRLFVANNVSAEYVLTEILKQTGWNVGIVDDAGLASFEFQGVTSYQALLEICTEYGLEVEPVIEVDEAGVSARYINLRYAIGEDRGIRFDYSYNLKGVTKTVLDEDVFTACYGYGNSLQTKTDGVTDKLTVYVADDESIEIWGVPGKNGEFIHSVGQYENSNCESMAVLTQETSDYLAAHSTPSISYNISVIDDGLEVCAGDVVDVVDKDFNPELRLSARVTAVKHNLVTDKVEEVTIGTSLSLLPDALTRTYKMAQNAMQSSSSSSGFMSDIDDLNKKYQDLQKQIDELRNPEEPDEGVDE